MSGPRELAERAARGLALIRERRPRVHCLMNSVAQKLVADGLTVVGAVPSMTSSVEEVADFVAQADAMLVNLGTLDAARREAITVAVETARGRGLPWSLDPVHCDASPSRRAFARNLLGSGPAVLRGNRAEMGSLGATAAQASVETGEVDRVATAGRALLVRNGHPWLAAVTGTGCLSGALIAAFLAVEDDPAHAALGALCVLGIAAEEAARASRGPGSFAPALLDALHGLDEATIMKNARIYDEEA